MASVAVFAPGLVGRRTTVIAQVPPGTTVAHPLGVVATKSPAFRPVVVALVTCRFALPVFRTVTVCGALATPTVVAANVSDVALTAIAGAPITGGAVPVPLRDTDRGLPAALSVTGRAPLRAA